MPCSPLRAQLSSEKVIDTLEWLFLVYGAPCCVRSDNGPEFIAKLVRDWLEAKHTETVYIEPGCPWENPFVESFHGSLRMECLNRHLFFSGAEAQAILDDWREDYNEFRPHSSLGGRRHPRRRCGCLCSVGLRPPSQRHPLT